MKHFINPLLSCSAPLLIVIALVGLLQRDGSDRLHALPALMLGIGLIISGAMKRRNRRKKLLLEISNRNKVDN